MVSGSTSTEIISPPRGSATATAAPTAPMKVMAGVPTRSVSVAAAMACGIDIHEQAEQRCGNHQRQHAGGPVREAFDQHGKRQHVAVGVEDQKIERAVLAVGLEQPVEAEQAGQQRADPQDRRADAGEQVEVGSDREGDGGDDGEEEQHPGQRAAAGADAEFHVAEEERGQLTSSQPQALRPFDPQRLMRRRDHDAAGRRDAPSSAPRNPSRTARRGRRSARRAATKGDG